MTPVALFSAGQVAALEAGEPVYLTINPETCPECGGKGDKPGTPISGFRPRVHCTPCRGSGRVLPVLPAVATKCPDCDGAGTLEVSVEGGPWRKVKCPPCGGSGWVGDPLDPDGSRLGVATEQWRFTNYPSRWVDGPPSIHLVATVERRTAVVAYTWVTEHLPVVRLRDVGRTQPPAIAVDGLGAHWFAADGSPIIPPPEIGDLTPGQVVLRCEGLVHLEQPITDIVCPRCSKRSEWCGFEDEPGVPDTGAVDGCSAGRVPLVVPPAAVVDIEVT